MRIVPARNGWQWLMTGLRLFGRSPLAWIAMVLFYWSLMMLANAVPWVGSIVGTVLLPVFSVSFMVMAREVEAGRRLVPPLLFAGFARNRRELLILGALYLAALVATLVLSMLADGGALARYMLFGDAPTAEEARSGAIAWAGMLAMLAYTPVLMAYWFAPVLAAWEDMSAAKSLFFSFFATWRNWRAFLVYGAAVSLLALPVLLFFLVIAGAVAGFGLDADSPDQRRLATGMLAGAPLFLALAAVLIASFYASYRDIFPPPSGESAPPPPQPPSQS